MLLHQKRGDPSIRAAIEDREPKLRYLITPDAMTVTTIGMGEQQTLDTPGWPGQR